MNSSNSVYPVYELCFVIGPKGSKKIPVRTSARIFDLKSLRATGVAVQSKIWGRVGPERFVLVFADTPHNERFLDRFTARSVVDLPRLVPLFSQRWGIEPGKEANLHLLAWFSGNASLLFPKSSTPVSDLEDTLSAQGTAWCKFHKVSEYAILEACSKNWI